MSHITLVAGVFAYVSLVVFLLISGKRALSKMNAFDLVVTVALGSILATMMLSKARSRAAGLSFKIKGGIVKWRFAYGHT